MTDHSDLIENFARAVSLRCHSHPGEERRSATERANLAKQALVDALSSQSFSLSEARAERDVFATLHREALQHWDAARQETTEWYEKYEAAEAEIERLKGLVAGIRECPQEPPGAEANGERLLRQLRSLAVALHAKHYADDAPGWQPLEDAEGILSQIDNMTTGLGRPAEKDVHLWSALQFYADGERDGGLRAQSALEGGKPALADAPSKSPDPSLSSLRKGAQL